MPRLDVIRESKVPVSGRMSQLASMFDLQELGTSRVEWHADVPVGERPWNVGLIVGPSGSGKTTAARELFGAQVVRGFDWPDDRSVVDAFPAEMGIRDISGLLGSIGFNSPPSWLRPFRVLSNGEQFRVTIARALAEADPSAVVAVDEFTSVIDRQVAKIASHSVQKAVRKRGMRFVAVSCHYDVVEWLQPDWIFQPDSGQFAWREVQRRPELRFTIRSVDRSAWRLFKRHHYLSGALATGAHCFGAFDGDQCVAFTSYIHFPHPHVRKIKHGHRLVVLPDYQGIGLGGRLDDWLGQYLWERGLRYCNVVAHPALINYYRKSPRWVQVHSELFHGASKNSRPSLKKRHAKSQLRHTYSFEYKPPVRTL